LTAEERRGLRQTGRYSCYGRAGEEKGDVKKVAVFGNAGGGKSTLAKSLAELTHIALYPLDRIQYRAGGGEVPYDEYLKAHAELLQRDAWIIDGYGCASRPGSACRADTLVYIDLPLGMHFLWVTKRRSGASL
jgi:adenylate kinase family enzyme